MGLPQPKLFLTVEEYLLGERDGTTRHEYILGQIYAMAGGSDWHNRISGNFFKKLDSALENKKCEVFIADMKIRLEPDTFYYPDVVVSCDDPPTDRYFRNQPVLLIEVLSPSTERIDQNEKLAAYKTIPSLREYAIVWQDAPRVLLYRKTESGWQSQMIADPDQVVVFESIGVTMTLDEIYRNVRW
jgi:Uma2 family endonuclease